MTNDPAVSAITPLDPEWEKLRPKGFLEHAVIATSQYDAQYRSMAAEILALRARALDDLAVWREQDQALQDIWDIVGNEQDVTCPGDVVEMVADALKQSAALLSSDRAVPPETCQGVIVEDGAVVCQCTHGHDGLCGFAAREDEWMTRFNKLPEIIHRAEERGRLASSAHPAFTQTPRNPMTHLRDSIADFKRKQTSWGTNPPSILLQQASELIDELAAELASSDRAVHPEEGLRYCNCADPENCREPVPGYICKPRASDRAVKEPDHETTQVSDQRSESRPLLSDMQSGELGEDSSAKAQTKATTAAEGLIASPASQEWELNYSVQAIKLVADLLTELKPEDLAARAAKMVATLRHAASRISAQELLSARNKNCGAEVSSPARPNNPKVVLRPSTQGGVGVFTIAAIPAGEHIELFDGTDWEIVAGDAQDLPDALCHFIVLTNGGYYRPRHFGRMSVGWYLNHGEDPSIRADGEDWVAVRDIREGEELTVNYRTLDDHVDNFAATFSVSSPASPLDELDWFIGFQRMASEWRRADRGATHSAFIVCAAELEREIKIVRRRAEVSSPARPRLEELRKIIVAFKDGTREPVKAAGPGKHKRAMERREVWTIHRTLNVVLDEIDKLAEGTVSAAPPALEQVIKEMRMTAIQRIRTVNQERLELRWADVIEAALADLARLRAPREEQ